MAKAKKNKPRTLELTEEKAENIVLSEAQKAIFDAWISEKFPNGLACPTCQGKGFLFGNHVVSTPLIHPTQRALVLAGKTPVYPFIVAICANCGNTQFFNAMISNVLSSDKAIQEEKKGGAENGNQ